MYILQTTCVLILYTPENNHLAQNEHIGICGRKLVTEKISFRATIKNKKLKLKEINYET